MPRIRTDTSCGAHRYEETAYGPLVEEKRHGSSPSASGHSPARKRRGLSDMARDRQDEVWLEVDAEA